MVKPSLLVLALLTPAVAGAQSAPPLATERPVSPSGFDPLRNRPGAAPQGAEPVRPITLPQPVGSWTETLVADKITGETRIGTSLQASRTVLQPPRRPEPSRTVPAELVFVCAKGRAAVYVVVENSLVAGRSARVEYRFSKSKPVASRSWRSATDYTAIGLWKTDATKAFINLAKGSETLYFRSVDNVFGVLEADFDLFGMTEALAPVRRACRF